MKCNKHSWNTLSGEFEYALWWNWSFNVDSSSPVRGSFEHCLEDQMNAEATGSALNEGSSSKTDLHHSGWTSSEEDADAMDQDDGGLSLACIDLFASVLSWSLVLSFSYNLIVLLVSNSSMWCYQLIVLNV